MSQDFTLPKHGSLRIWWVPNPPRTRFEREVEDVDEAMSLLDLLCDYDNYLGDNHIVANVGGLEIFDEETAKDFEDDCDGWVEWEDDEGDDIMQCMRIHTDRKATKMGDVL